MKSVHLPRHDIDADLPRHDNFGGLFGANIFGNNMLIFGNNNVDFFRNNNDAGGLFRNNDAGGLFRNNNAGIFGNNNDNNNRWIGEGAFNFF